jgi:Zn-dependent protease
MFHNSTFNLLILKITALLAAVTVHEVAHGFAAYRLGDNTAKLAGRLTLNPIKHLDLFGSCILPLILAVSGSPFLFGYAKPVPVDFNKIGYFKKNIILVASAGVAANIFLAVSAGIVFQIMSQIKPLWYNLLILGPVLFDLYNLLAYTVIINSVLAIFNLIPIPPLDGSRILSALLPNEMKIYFDKIERFGMLILLLLLMTNIFNKIISFFLVPMMNLLLGR